MRSEVLEELVGAPLAVVERVAVQPLTARQHHLEAQLELADVACFVVSQDDIHLTSRHIDGGGVVVAVLDADN